MIHFDWHASMGYAALRFPLSARASQDFRWMNARGSWLCLCTTRWKTDGRRRRSDLCFSEARRKRHLRGLLGPLLTPFEALYAEFSLNWGCIGERQAPRMGGSAARKRNSRIRTVTSWKATA